MMYGSIHTHFESRFDTANGDFTTMLKSFAAEGCKKVVVTDHGTFSAFEDVREKAKEIEDCPEIIPGVEGYFENKKDHIVLFAKDKKGYESLCKIITQSNADMEPAKKKDDVGTPIINLDNLKKNVAKGHIVCTSACIGGIFGTKFALERVNLEQKLEEIYKELTSFIDLESTLILTKEQLQTSAFKAYKTLVIYESDTEVITVYDICKAIEKPCVNKYEILLQNYYITKANALIVEKLKKEKMPKATKAHPVSKGAIDNYKCKQQILTNVCNMILTNVMKDCEQICKVISKKRKTIKFTTLKKVIDLFNVLPSEEEAFEKCKILYNKLIRIFGEDDFYFELQNHGLEIEKNIYNKVVDFAKSVGNTTHFIASNDIHIGISKKYIPEKYHNFDEYLKDEVTKRDVIRFSRYNKFFNNDDAITSDEYEYYIKNNEELQEMLLKIIDDREIVENAVNNIEKVLSEVYIVYTSTNHYPSFCKTEAETIEMFEQAIKDGIKQRFPFGLTKDREKRLITEKNTIINMGYASYHLIVADYLEYGRLLGQLPSSVINSDNCPSTIEDVKTYIEENGIVGYAYSIGPGRGSAAGSLVCYVLGITDVDPCEYDLLFERFLNPERVSMPDIDADFSPLVRDKAIEYVKKKYGESKVCGIMTKSYLALKGAIRLAGRYIGSKSYIAEQSQEKQEDYLKSYNTIADMLCKEFDKSGLTDKDFINLKLKQGSDIERKYIELTDLIVGLFANYGQHAAGVIISKDNLSNQLPLMYNENRKFFETQCNMAQAETKGYLKMDFLGLKNLSILTDIAQMTMDNNICDLEKRKEILNDKRIYSEIYAKGLTQGVFQVEKEGIKNIMVNFLPECFEDVVLIIAAYRPGPMQYIPEIIEEKWHRKNPNKYPKPKHSIEINNATLQKILEPTYGCIIYQEQIMRICRELAGFSMAEADNIRRYMSKKKYEALEKKRLPFIEGCVSLSELTKAEANDLFEQMKEFAKYAFNKSHAVVYSLISIFTAYYKLYHPVAFFTVSLNYVEQLKEIPAFIAEFANFGIGFKGPDIIKSSNYFTCDDTHIYYGLKFIKGMSKLTLTKPKSYLEFILENREVLSDKILEKLIKCGLFDSLEPDITRSDLLAITKTIFKQSKAYFKAKEKQSELETKLNGLKAFANKTRLSIEEKQSIQNIINGRRNLGKITPKTVTELIEIKKAEIAKQYKVLEEIMDDLEGILRRTRITSKHTNESVLENRKNESELLGYVFDIKDSLNRIAHSNTLPKKKGIVDTNIPNLGLIVLNPCVRITKCGWHKVLCMDKNYTQKAFYFKEPLPENTTELLLNFKAEEENYVEAEKSHYINIKPHAYTLEDVKYMPIRYLFTLDKYVYEQFARMQANKNTHPTAYLHYAEKEIGIPCDYHACVNFLKEYNAEYIEWAA